MKKSILLVLVLSLAAGASFGQSTKPKLDEVKNNPKTTENAAKADAQQVNKTNVDNSKVIDYKALKRKQQGRKVKTKSTKSST
jgi:hypothetical protein